MANNYEEALQEAKNAVLDIKERGEAAISEEEWQDVRKELFTPKEIAESDLRVAVIGIIIKAKNAGMSFEQVEEIIKETLNGERKIMAATA